MGGSLQCVLEHTETADYGLIFTKNLLKLTKNSLKLTKNSLKLTKNLLKLTKNLRISRNSYEYLTKNLRAYEYGARKFVLCLPLPLQTIKQQNDEKKTV